MLRASPPPPCGPGPRGCSGRSAPCSSPAVWLATQNHSTLVTERSAVPFLPVNPEYSATRNQVRGLDRGPGWPPPLQLSHQVPLLGSPALWALPFLAGCCVGFCLGLLFSSPGPGLLWGPTGTGIWKRVRGWFFFFF